MRAYLKSGERHKVGVVGLGKLGLPMASLLSFSGHDVVGCDLNQQTVDAVNEGLCPISEPGVQTMLTSHPWRATTDIKALADVEAVLVIVPTPSDGLGRFENVYVRSVLLEVADLFRGTTDKTVVVCSTVMPGSMDGELRDALESTGLVAGETVDFLYSPEFIALGSVLHNMRHPETVIIGSVNGSATDLYQRILIPTHGPMFPVKRDPHQRYAAPTLHELSAVEAEIAKIAVNTYVTMKISFANVLGELVEKLGGKPTMVAEAVGTDSRIGKSYLKPGAAFGGPCFPRDTEAFHMFCVENGVLNDLPIATREINKAQARRLARKVGFMHGVKTVAVLGVAYKPGTPVIEESAGIAVANHLVRSGYHVVVTDEVADDPMLDGMRWIADPQAAIDVADAVLIMCPHEKYKILEYGNNLIDPWRLVSA